MTKYLIADFEGALAASPQGTLRLRPGAAGFLAEAINDSDVSEIHILSKCNLATVETILNGEQLNLKKIRINAGKQDGEFTETVLSLVKQIEIKKNESDTENDNNDSCTYLYLTTSQPRIQAIRTQSKTINASHISSDLTPDYKNAHAILFPDPIIENDDDDDDNYHYGTGALLSNESEPNQQEPSFFERYPSARKALVGALIGFSIFIAAVFVTAAIGFSGGAAAVPIAAFGLAVVATLGAAGTFFTTLAAGVVFSTLCAGIAALIGGKSRDNNPSQNYRSPVTWKSTDASAHAAFNYGGKRNNFDKFPEPTNSDTVPLNQTHASSATSNPSTSVHSLTHRKKERGNDQQQQQTTDGNRFTSTN